MSEPPSAAGFARPVNRTILQQHLDDAAALRSTRSVLVRAPHVKLHLLARADDRLAAHLDGLLVAGDAATAAARGALDVPGLGAIFVVAWLAIKRRDAASWSRVLALVDVLPDARRAIASALGWVSSASLRGLAVTLVADDRPSVRWLGMLASLLHGVDPGGVLGRIALGNDPADRAAALVAAARLGRIDMLPTCRSMIDAPEAIVAASAAWAAVVLGDRAEALHALGRLAESPGPNRMAALSTALMALDLEAGRALLRAAYQRGLTLRDQLRCIGWMGDARAVPWLLLQMREPELARLAGESLALVTGLDLSAAGLEAVAAPAGVSASPDDDPAHDEVALDEDESLPWPDVARVEDWWRRESGRFASEAALLLGRPPDPAACLETLAIGGQRQRRVAALRLALREPGRPIFNVAAPAWRQARLLGRGSAT